MLEASSPQVSRTTSRPWKALLADEIDEPRLVVPDDDHGSGVGIASLVFCHGLAHEAVQLRLINQDPRLPIGRRGTVKIALG
jgi:hypothetical protein